MKTSETHQMLLNIGAIAQHEAAHCVAALASGFDAHQISLHYQLYPQAHRGKAYADYNIRCDSLTELHDLMTKKVVIALSGAMGEAIDRSTFKVNAITAYKILDEGATGASQDFAVAKELVNLIHNSSPVTADAETGKDSTSVDLLRFLLEAALRLVESNAKQICMIADALVKKVVEGKGIGELQRDDIEQLLTPPEASAP
ncbi:hypothetical protein [Pseudomonas sp. Root569]|uniref:hypothetical protein n=1 Tax=Pseudomonas sp. Root569 TaxID=1736566 RepID=UPI0007025563|nr:hypothetical protein [Pseudomonas sp. Root569]KRA21881.1 hypothetical protein ASD70_21350 [Pseudomonas sp. Root569]